MKNKSGNVLRVFSAIFAIALLAIGYKMLPDVRSEYQQNKKPPGVGEEYSNIVYGESETLALDATGAIDADQLLDQWRNDRNQVGGGTEDIDPAEDAAEKFNDIRIVRKVPQTESDVRRAHDTSRRLSCELIGENQPLIMKDYASKLTERDASASKVRGRSLYSRLGVISIGFDMQKRDQQTLPSVSAPLIMKVLRSDYVSLQVRTEKDPVNGTVFLHPRPMAALATYGFSNLTKEPQQAMVESLKNYRGIGMYVPEGEQPRYESLRTIVLVHRSERKKISESGSELITPHYELMFVQAVPGSDKQLKLHAFVTSENRTKLHYLREELTPATVKQSTLVTQLAFTKYALNNQKPVESVTTGTVINQRREFLIADLDKYAAEKEWVGTALDNLPQTLNAIINRDITDNLGSN